MDSILVVRSGSEAPLGLALDDLDRRFPGTPVILLSDPDLSTVTMARRGGVQLVEYENLRRFFGSQLGSLRGPIYEAKVVLLTGETEIRYAKFKLIFLLFSARRAIAYNHIGENSEVSLSAFGKRVSLSVYVVLNALRYMVDVSIRDIMVRVIRILLLPVALPRLALSIALVFARKWYFSVLHRSPSEAEAYHDG